MTNLARTIACCAVAWAWKAAYTRRHRRTWQERTLTHGLQMYALGAAHATEPDPDCQADSELVARFHAAHPFYRAQINAAREGRQ